MDTLALYLDRFEDGRLLEKDGIVFSNVSIVKLLIDGEDLDDVYSFQNSLIYFNELRESTLNSGSYFIFTCACGVAEDGGWEGVIVTHSGEVVEWTIDVGSRVYRYVFNKQRYCDEIEALRMAINISNLPMEPRQVIFPLGFHR